MPTPFYHLYLAEELIQHPCLPLSIRSLLKAQRGQFFFGTTAPDVQVVSGQLREETHFFRLPILVGDRPGWKVLFSQYPGLAVPQQLPAGQAAFVAGYISHLLADWLWIKLIFAPAFGLGCGWGTFQKRLYYHNALRAYMDQRIIPVLYGGIGACLHSVEPNYWLPFVLDDHLYKWRDFLSSQLEPGASSKTVDVFSSRQGITATEYYTLIESTERMQKEVFNHVSLEQLHFYRKQVLEDNIRLISHYMAFALHQNIELIKSDLVGGESL